MTLKFSLEKLIRRKPEEVFCFMKNIYRLPWHTSPVVLIYDKTTPGEVAEGTEFSERVRLSAKREILTITRVTEVDEGKLLRYEWHGAGMRGELIYRFAAEGEGAARMSQIQTIVLRGGRDPRGAPHLHTIQLQNKKAAF